LGRVPPHQAVRDVPRCRHPHRSIGRLLRCGELLYVPLRSVVPGLPLAAIGRVIGHTTCRPFVTPFPSSIYMQIDQLMRSTFHEAGIAGVSGRSPTAQVARLRWRRRKRPLDAARSNFCGLRSRLWMLRWSTGTRHTRQFVMPPAPGSDGRDARRYMTCGSPLYARRRSLSQSILTRR
jgi:hypothetical protein